MINYEEKLRAICSYFDLGSIQHTQQTEGVNENYFVTTARGQFFIKIILTHPFEEVQKELLFLHRLEEYGYTAAAYYLKNAEGSAIYHKGNCVAVAMMVLKGDKPRLSESVCKAVGFNLAKLHLIPAGSLPEKRHWLDDRFLAESIEAVSKRIDQRQLQEILRVSAAIRNFKPEDFPQSIVHGDINPTNCLFLGWELRALIDWEEVGIGASVLDFARSVLGFCFVDQPDSSVAFDVHLYKSLYDGYTRIRAFTPEEERAVELAVKYACITQLVLPLLQGEELTEDHISILYWIVDQWKLKQIE